MPKLTPTLSDALDAKADADVAVLIMRQHAIATKTPLPVNDMLAAIARCEQATSAVRVALQNSMGELPRP